MDTESTPSARSILLIRRKIERIGGRKSMFIPPPLSSRIFRTTITGLDLAAHGPEQYARGIVAGPHVVPVRVGLVADDERGQLRPAPRQVRVLVEGIPHGHLGADHRADRFQQVALGIAHALDAHRPVQRQVDAVDPSGGTQALDDLGLEPFVHRALHGASRDRVGPQEGHDLDLAPAQVVDGPQETVDGRLRSRGCVR